MQMMVYGNNNFAGLQVSAAMACPGKEAYEILSCRPGIATGENVHGAGSCSKSRRCCCCCGGRSWSASLMLTDDH
jgi:hypothetical protein